MSYIKSDGGPPNVRRAEDGPIGFKGKFTAWPNTGPAASTKTGKTKAGAKTAVTAKAPASGGSKGGNTTSASKGK